MKKVTIDIETIPAQSQWVRDLVAKEVTPPGNYKKQDTIDKWYEDKYEDAVDKALHQTGLDATMGEIAVICFCVDQEEVQTCWRDPTKGHSEKHVLEVFYQGIAKALHGDSPENHRYQTPKFIGHNVRFDLGFIWRRSVINSVTPTVKIPYMEPPWSEYIIDTQYMWTGGDRSTSGSLDTIAKAMGFSGKTMHGSEVWQKIQDGKIDEVVEYCKGDVILTRMIYDRMKEWG